MVAATVLPDVPRSFAISRSPRSEWTFVVAVPEVYHEYEAPGTVLPPESMSDEEVRLLADRAPLKRNGTPHDVVRALRYLLQADFVTGETLVVDGGRLLRG